MRMLLYMICRKFGERADFGRLHIFVTVGFGDSSCGLGRV